MYMNVPLHIAQYDDLWLVVAVVVIVVLGGMLVAFYVQNKNLRKLIGIYKAEHVELRRQIDTAFNAWKDSARAIKIQPDGDPVPAKTKELDDERKPRREAESLSDEDLFKRMETRLREGKAFLNPKLSRDDLAAIMGVDKNRFGAIMKEYGKVNSCAVYLNRMRIDYAIMLMSQHPNFTIDAIARACGMTNTVTFTNYFKRYHDMTPSEYRTKSQRR